MPQESLRLKIAKSEEGISFSYVGVHRIVLVFLYDRRQEIFVSESGVIDLKEKYCDVQRSG